MNVHSTYDCYVAKYMLLNKTHFSEIFENNFLVLTSGIDQYPLW